MYTLTCSSEYLQDPCYPEYKLEFIFIRLFIFYCGEKALTSVVDITNRIHPVLAASTKRDQTT